MLSNTIRRQLFCPRNFSTARVLLQSSTPAGPSDSSKSLKSEVEPIVEAAASAPSITENGVTLKTLKAESIKFVKPVEAAESTEQTKELDNQIVKDIEGNIEVTHESISSTSKTIETKNENTEEIVEQIKKQNISANSKKNEPTQTSTPNESEPKKSEIGNKSVSASEAEISEIKYEPKTFSSDVIHSATNRPIPLNVELLYADPIKIEPKHHILCAEVVFKSYYPEGIEFYSNFALRVGYYLGMPLTGPKPLPKRTESWTLIRSPFVQAKSKENFERHTHGRLIKVWDTNPEVIDLWLAYLHKHSVGGVGIKAHIYNYESVESFSELTQGANSSQAPQDEAVAARVKELLNDPAFKTIIEGEKALEGKAN